MTCFRYFCSQGPEMENPKDGGAWGLLSMRSPELDMTERLSGSSNGRERTEIPNLRTLTLWENPVGWALK